MNGSFISVDQVTAFENQLYTTVSLGNIWKFYWIWQLSSSLAIGCVLSTLYKFPISILNSTLAELVFLCQNNFVRIWNLFFVKKCDGQLAQMFRNSLASLNAKGQLISKANSKLFIWTKKPMKIFLYFCPSL